MNFNNLPEYNRTQESVKNNKCFIDGEKYPLFFHSILSMMESGNQPIICFPADQGKGKTMALSKMAEILHNDLNILNDSFDPKNQIISDPLKYIRNVRNSRKKMFIVPDSDSVFPSDDYHKAKNKANRDVIYLSRILGNILSYDTHELSKTDKAIRTNHNIRITTLQNSSKDYKYNVERIYRKNDSLKEEIEKVSMGSWTPDLPSKKTQKRIEELDKDRKIKHLKDREEQIEKERSDDPLEKALDF